MAISDGLIGELEMEAAHYSPSRTDFGLSTPEFYSVPAIY